MMFFFPLPRFLFDGKIFDRILSRIKNLCTIFFPIISYSEGNHGRKHLFISENKLNKRYLIDLENVFIHYL